MAKKTDIRFVGALELSAVHASFVVATGGQCSDTKVESALVRPTTEINNRLVSASVDVRAFWSSLFSSVATGQTLRDASREALLCAGCSELQVDQTAAAVGSRLEECRMAFQKRFPKLSEQLQLRAGPLKDRWQTFGPGLLIQIANQIWGSSPPTDWWPAKMDALLVQPIRGGDGGFDAQQNHVWIEAMLTDADANVSEIFRLAFWITQVAIGRHLESKFGAASTASDPEDLGSSVLRSSGHPTSPLPWKLGCVPIVLAAGAELELFRTPELPVSRAIEIWGLGGPEVASVVDAWWKQWGEADAAIPVALKALDKMLLPLRQRKTVDRPMDADDFADL